MADWFDSMDCPPAVEVSSEESTNADSNKNNYDLTAEVSSPFPALAGDVNLELRLNIGGGCSDSGDSSMVGWPPMRRGHRMVKVTMDGMIVGRKVDLCAHNSYETLAQTLEEMFFEKDTEAAGRLNLLDGKSEFVLTYKDKNDNHMLLGDVPWRMFLSSVKRLRIMRNSFYI